MDKICKRKECGRVIGKFRQVYCSDKCAKSSRKGYSYPLNKVAQEIKSNIIETQ